MWIVDIKPIEENIKQLNTCSIFIFNFGNLNNCELRVKKIVAQKCCKQQANIWCVPGILRNQFFFIREIVFDFPTIKLYIGRAL